MISLPCLLLLPRPLPLLLPCLPLLRLRMLPVAGLHLNKTTNYGSFIHGRTRVCTSSSDTWQGVFKQKVLDCHPCLFCNFWTFLTITIAPTGFPDMTHRNESLCQSFTRPFGLSFLSIGSLSSIPSQCFEASPTPNGLPLNLALQLVPLTLLITTSTPSAHFLIASSPCPLGPHISVSMWATRLTFLLSWTCLSFLTWLMPGLY